jgi:acyltransferase
MGHIVSEKRFINKPYYHPRVYYAFAVFMLAILILCVMQNGKVNMNKMKFGNLVYFYLGAFSGISLSILCARIIPSNKLLKWISMNTIIIFPLHILVYSAITGTCMVLFNLDHSFNKHWSLSLLYPLGTLAICVPASYIIKRYFPYIIGLDREKAIKSKFK